MVQKPVVFISSTSDLRSARDLVGKVLHSMGYEPVWQDIEPTDGGELLDVLRERMAPCALMIQLVGQRYGAEPPASMRPAEFGRVSYSQFEALHFEETLRRKVIYHFLEPTFPTDPASPEPPELSDLQAAYRTRIEKNNRLHQAKISSTQDLELSIHRIRVELAVLRRESDRRYRKMILLAGGAVAGIVVVAALVAGGVHLLRGGQSEHAAKLDKQSVKIDQQAAKADDQSQQLARIEKLLLAQKQANPQAEPALSDTDRALLEQARKQGDLKTRATASVLRPDANTDALLKELQAEHESQEFDLAMLQGKRWYFDKLPQYDKAIPSFERAMALRPDSFDARNYAALARTSARLGDIAAHQKRAIEIYQGTLPLVKPRSAEWAATQNNLGNAWLFLPIGDRAANLANAIAAYEAALQVYTRQDFPAEWAAAQNNLGIAWDDVPTGDRAANLANAIAAYEAALQVYTRQDFPANWATTQNNLGAAWQSLPTGDRAANLAKAIAAYEAALQVYTRQDFPANWAMTHNNLGAAWQSLATGDRAANLAKAIAAYETALQVRTRQDFPADWARTQNNLAITLADLAEQPGEDRCGRLRQAIASGKAALIVFTAEAFPREHANALKNLSIDRKAYESSGCAKKTPFDDIPAAE